MLQNPHITNEKQCLPHHYRQNLIWTTTSRIFTRKSWSPLSIIFEKSQRPRNKGGSHYEVNT